MLNQIRSFRQKLIWEIVVGGGCGGMQEKTDTDLSKLNNVEYFSPSETEFEPDPYIGGSRKYGPSEIQPSVGDAGAPVFSFRNSSENLQSNSSH